jgi:cytochrome c-type biogenesis protein CcmE
MSPQNRNRLLAVGAILVAGLALGLMAMGTMSKNLVYYWSPGDLLAQGEKAYGPTIRLGGIVVPGSIQWNAGHTSLTFQVANDRKPGSPKVDVKCDEVPPQMFREGIGVVVEGSYDASTIFKSNRLMVNHSNEYRPPKEGENQKDWQKSLLEPQAKN